MLGARAPQQFANSLTPWDLLTCSQKWLARLTPFSSARASKVGGPVRIRDDRAVKRVLPRHQQFKHHEIGEENVWLCLPNALAFLLALLAGIACKRIDR